ncbi:MAG: hypothetical protein ACLPVF_07695 [Acidimicrobiales bacterium]
MVGGHLHHEGDTLSRAARRVPVLPPGLLRALLASALLLGTVVASVGAGGGGVQAAQSRIDLLAADCAPSTPPAASADTSVDAAISGQLGPGWIGGDTTYSTELPDGQEAFDFADTLIGTSQSSGRATLTGMVQNSELIGDLPDLNGDYAGTYRTPRPLIPDTLDPDDQWQVAATYVENDRQLVFVNEFAPVSGSPYNRFTGRSGIAVLSVPTGGSPTLISITLIPTDPTTRWGDAVTQDPFYTYVYGVDSDTSTGDFYGMKLARVPRGDTLVSSDWQYWNGSGWAGGEASAATIPTTNELTGVALQTSEIGYIAVSIPGELGRDKTVDVSFACSPEGPWSTPVPVYTIPEISEYHDEIAYIPTFHPELSGQGDLVVSYNVDTTDGLTALQQDVHAYQPRFLELG